MKLEKGFIYGKFILLFALKSYRTADLRENFWINFTVFFNVLKFTVIF